MTGRKLAEMAMGIDTEHINDGAITEVKIGENAVGSSELKAEVTPVSTQYTQSGEEDITAGAAINWQHNLGATPKKHGIKLKCIIAERGYQVGEIMDYPNQNIGVGSNNHNIAVSADNTNVYVKVGITTGVFGGGGPILIIRRDNGGSETLTEANWKLIIWAEL